MFLSLTYSFTFFFILILILTSSSLSSHVATFTPPPTKISITSHNIQSLNNADKGTKIAGISQFKRYLHRFGYLRNNNNDSFSFNDEYDVVLESALVRYQGNLGLQVTGKLDSDTVAQMITPRCGDPDTNTRPHNHDHNHNHNHVHSSKNFVFFPGKPRWSRSMPMTLTYAFSRENMIRGGLSMKEIREAFQRAFSRWASVIPVSFVERCV
ncbi:gelatinase A [Vigna unguiculata]|uniref:Gelatinase A n=1 Tax=Vigna unguiculata TaxID=3917 RepID=A0A4D6MVK1_VIGUN|nr:gelatinase A [Vigna unguiculata]